MRFAADFIRGDKFVTQWEYRTIDLNQGARKVDDVDLLNEAGEDGWDLVTITANSVAYLRHRPDRDLDAAADEPANDERTPDVKPKYRDPATGDTWSGRGRTAHWLKVKQGGGEDVEKYRA